MAIPKAFVIDVSKSAIEALKIIAIIAGIGFLTSLLKAFISGMESRKCNGGCVGKKTVLLPPSMENIPHKDKNVQPVIILKDKEKKRGPKPKKNKGKD